MGLSHWIESDASSGLYYTIQDLFVKYGMNEKKLKKAIRSTIQEQLDSDDDNYNTPGYVNLALCLAAEGKDYINDLLPIEGKRLPKFSQYISTPQLRKASRLFVKGFPTWDKCELDQVTNLHSIITKMLKFRRESNR